MLYWDFNPQRCVSGALEHDSGPLGRAKQNVCPQKRTLKSRIAPGPAYVAYMKARWRTEGKLDVDALGAVYEDEDVGEQDVWKSRDGGKGITKGLQGLDTMGVFGETQLTVNVVECLIHCYSERRGEERRGEESTAISALCDLTALAAAFNGHHDQATKLWQEELEVWSGPTLCPV